MDVVIGNNTPEAPLWMTIEVEKIKAKKAASGCVEVRSVHCTVVKKKVPAMRDFPFYLLFQNNKAAVPLRLTVKVKAVKKAVLMMVHCRRFEAQV